MSPAAPSVFFALISASYVAAEGLTWAPTPLVDLHFPHPSDAPYKVWPDEPAFERGPQSGYNMCNSTTEGEQSLCQTAYFNGLDDFCLWAPPNPNSVIGDTEGDEVAWCTRKGYGTRLLPDGVFKSAQLLKSNDYWMLVGSIDQTKMNIQAGDYGGELDSGSQDGRGNPIGGLVYSSAFAKDVTQVSWWTQFIGSDQFCIKICNPASKDQHGYCQHTLDRIGLAYNCPSKFSIGGNPVADGEFEVCDTDNMDIPGIYVDAAGATQSYSQPAESLGEITSIPYTPTAPASRNCKPTPSAELFNGAPAATTPPAQPSPSSSSTGASSPQPASSSKSSTAAATGKPSSSSAVPSAPTNKPAGNAANTGTTSAPPATNTDNGASAILVSSAFSAAAAAIAFVAFL